MEELLSKEWYDVDYVFVLASSYAEMRIDAKKCPQSQSLYSRLKDIHIFGDDENVIEVWFASFGSYKRLLNKPNLRKLSHFKTYFHHLWCFLQIVDW